MAKQLMVGALGAQSALILAGFLLLAGCTGKTVPVEIPKDHPAHPEAVESIYVPPPNPFMSDIFHLKADSPEPAHGQGDSEAGRPKDSGYGTDHKMMKGPSPGSKAGPGGRSTEHHNMEHR
jgi:hypothetical protein